MLFQQLIRDYEQNQATSLKCTKEGHQNYLIIRFCLQYGCDKPRSACGICLKDHQDHLTNLFPLSFLNEIIFNEEQKLSKLLNNIINCLETKAFKTIITSISELLNDLNKLKIQISQLLNLNSEQQNDIIKHVTKCYANIFYQELLNVIFSQNWSIQENFLKQTIVQELHNIYNEENLDYLCQLMFQKGNKRNIKGFTLLLIGRVSETLQIIDIILFLKPDPELQQYKGINFFYQALFLSIQKSLTKEQFLSFLENTFIEQNMQKNPQFYLESNQIYIFFILAQIEFYNKRYHVSLNYLMKIPEDLICKCVSESVIRSLFGIKMQLKQVKNLLIIEKNKNSEKKKQIENVNIDDELLYQESIFLLNQNLYKQAYILLDLIQPYQHNYKMAQLIKGIKGVKIGDILIKKKYINQEIEQEKRSNVMTSEFSFYISLPYEEELELINIKVNDNKNKYDFTLFIRKCFILYNRAKYNEIQDCLDLALTYYPNKSIFYNMRAISLVFLRKFNEALEIIEEMLQKNNDQSYWLRLKGSNFFNQKGKVLYFSGRFEESMKMYKLHCSQFSSSIEGYFDKGVILYFEKKHYESLINFDQVLKINPSCAPALYNKGLILLYLERDEEALQIFKTIQYFEKSKLLCIQILLKKQYLEEALTLIQKPQGNQKYLQRLLILKCLNENQILDQVLLKQRKFQEAYEIMIKVNKKKLKWYLWHLIHPLIIEENFAQAQALIYSEKTSKGDDFFDQVAQGIQQFNQLGVLMLLKLFSYALILYNDTFSYYERSLVEVSQKTINQLTQLYQDSEALQLSIQEIRDSIQNQFDMSQELNIKLKIDQYTFLMKFDYNF